jgi:hypothetical protein
MSFTTVYPPRISPTTAAIEDDSDNNTFHEHQLPLTFVYNHQCQVNPLMTTHSNNSKEPFSRLHARIVEQVSGLI